MALVRHALHDPSVTAIREVGVKDGYALVMTSSREKDSPTPDYDLWTVYNLSLKTGQTQVLVSGYGVQIIDWIGKSKDELSLTYFDCWECEPAKLFTTLQFIKEKGWRARWTNKTWNPKYPKPGVVISMSDLEEPYDDDDVDQIFAIVKQPNGEFAIGRWVHTRDQKTGKITEDVERYSIDNSTEADRMESLKGAAALNWKQEICTASNVIQEPSAGLESKSCRNVLRKLRLAQPSAK